VVVECTALADDKLRIAVQDTGMGLSPAQLGELFQPFNRLGQEAGGTEGTGIGLVVTRHLVEMMGGEIGVASTVGMGTVFWIELQNAGDHAPKSPPALPEDSAFASWHDGMESALILCVEDNPASLKLIQEIVSHRSDLTLLSAHDAGVGIELAKLRQPRVILMDNNLPGMSGSQALSVLRNDPRTAHIPVIAITANAMPDAVTRGLDRGFFRYLTKPIEVQELMAAVDQALMANPVTAASV
jgi:CheY-like chemotaxis protein